MKHDYSYTTFFTSFIGFINLRKAYKEVDSNPFLVLLYFNRERVYFSSYLLSSRHVYRDFGEKRLVHDIGARAGGVSKEICGRVRLPV